MKNVCAKNSNLCKEFKFVQSISRSKSVESDTKCYVNQLAADSRIITLDQTIKLRTFPYFTLFSLVLFSPTIQSRSPLLFL